jgi:hypothetical protein
MQKKYQNLHPTNEASEKKHIRFGVCDIESDEWINLVCIGFHDGKENVTKVFESISTFMDYVFSYCKKNEIAAIFAHFGGKFDFNFIFGDTAFNKKYKIDTAIPRGSSILCFTVLENKIRKGKKRPFSITFWDSSALLPFALRSLAKTFDIPTQKGDIDYLNLKNAYENKDYTKGLFESPDKFKVFHKGKVVKNYKSSFKKSNIKYQVIDNDEILEYKHPIENKKDVVHYLHGDLEALYQCIDKFYHWPLIREAGSSYTIAAQSVKIWQTFLTEPIFSIPTKADRFIREAYAGGRTEIFKPMFDATYDVKKNPDKLPANALKELKYQKKIGKLYYYDVNSLYPTVMQNNVFGNKFMGFVYGKESYDKDMIGFWKVSVDVPKDMWCPCLGMNHTFANGDVKYIFPTGKFSGTWSIVEIEYAKSLGIKVTEYHKGAIFQNGGKIFEEFITTLYAMRLEAKAKGDDLTNFLTKLIMNSTYGKIGMRLNKENLVMDTGNTGVKYHSEIRKKGKSTVRLATKEVQLESFTNVQISAYVTAYSRILMHKIYLKCGKKHLYYTDTDSIFSTKKFNVGDELGQVKLEYTCESAAFLLPKTYINEGVEGESFEKKVTMKGFDKKKIGHFTFNDFKHTLQGEMQLLKINQAPKFATLKTALRKGRFLCMNFDPNTDREIDRDRMSFAKDDLEWFTDCNISNVKKMFRIHPHVEMLKKEDPALFNDLMSGKEEEIKKEVKRLKARISTYRRKLEKNEYKESERSIKSQYDKRIISSKGFDSDPINLNIPFVHVREEEFDDA